MTRSGRISGIQLVFLLLAGRLSSCLLLPSDSLHALTVPDLIAVTAVNALFLWLLALPSLRGTPHDKVSAAVYVPVGLFVIYLDLLQFRDFAEKTVKAEFSVTLLTVTLMAVGIAAALYGMEAVGRVATVVSVAGLVLLFLFGCLLLPHARSVNIPPAVFSGGGTVWRQTLKELPRTAELVAVGALYPSVNGKVSRAYAWFVGLNAALTLFVCMITTAVLGDYAGMTPYPFYTAVSAVGFGAFGRSDLLVVALWLGTFFVRIALFGTIVTEQAVTLCGRKAHLPAAGIGAVLLTVTLVLTRFVAFEGQWQLVTYVYWGALLLCVTLPLWRRKRV